MRTFSSTAISAILAESTGEIPVLLCRLYPYGETLPANAWRFVRDNQDMTASGLLYTGFGFDVVLPEENGNSMPSVNLSLDNVGQELSAAILANTQPLQCEIEIRLRSEPNLIMAGPWCFTLSNVAISATTIVAELRYEDVLNEPFPCVRMTPRNFPGIFQR